MQSLFLYVYHDLISISQYGARSLLSHKYVYSFSFLHQQVQDEESALTEAGSKVVIREMRYAVGRISLIDCRTKTVVIDDHVQPREQVKDYLTRFSGIVAKDLDPKQSPHHLIGTRAAYLKLRYLTDRGCIFVGHGLQQGENAIVRALLRTLF